MASVGCLPGPFSRHFSRSCAQTTLRGGPPDARAPARNSFSADRKDNAHLRECTRATGTERGDNAHVRECTRATGTDRGGNAHVRRLARSWNQGLRQRQRLTAYGPPGVLQHGVPTARSGLAADPATVVTSCSPLEADPATVVTSCSPLEADPATVVTACSPLEALERGQWVKLICGASFEDVCDIRNLALVYTLAGVDCIDCAASPAIVAAVHEGIDAAYQLLDQSRQAGQEYRSGSAAIPGPLRRTPLSPRPWVMVSVSDSEDPHFRKAAFDPTLCPADCRRPCEIVCPTAAISFQHVEDLEPQASAGVAVEWGMKLPSPVQNKQATSDGVVVERCYGCGRCVPACPYHLIRTESYQRSLDEVGHLLQSPSVDAVEIHTLPGHLLAFAELWRQIGRHAGSLKLVAVSSPDQGLDMDDVMRAMYDVMGPDLKCPNLWQLDGRPMSGDLGAITAKAAVKLAGKVLAWEERPPGFLQLAGGTNEHSFQVMDAAGVRMIWPQDEEQGIVNGSKVVHGIAFGGSARSQLAEILQKLQESEGSSAGGRLENELELLEAAFQVACRLVDPFKTVK